MCFTPPKSNTLMFLQQSVWLVTLNGTCEQPPILQVDLPPKEAKLFSELRGFWICGLWTSHIFLLHLDFLSDNFPYCLSKFPSLLKTMSYNTSLFWFLHFFLEYRTRFWLLSSKVGFAFRSTPNFPLFVRIRTAVPSWEMCCFLENPNPIQACLKAKSTGH